MTDLPLGWATAPLADICDINPRVDKSKMDHDQQVSFVPMPAVEAENGRIDVSDTRNFGAVKQGYTPFCENDVLFAKITPCMENGKMAIVPKMVSEYGFGSTEFHVLRALCGVQPRFIYHLVSNRGFRYHAEHNMTGAVGQKRVPVTLLSEHQINVPPLNEQRRIVEKIEAMFERIDKGVENLRAARSTLALYRQSLLKFAFEGRLTAVWRAKNPSALEDPKALLARIGKERDTRYKAALADWQTALTHWRDAGETGKKPAKPRRNPEPDAPMFEQRALMSGTPPEWRWLQIGEFGFVTKLAGFEYTKHVTYKEDGDLPVIKAENAGKGGFKVTDFSRVRSEEVAMLTRSLLSGGELLMVFVGAGTGQVATVPSDQQYFLGPNIGMIRLETAHILPRYFEHFLRSPIGSGLKLASVKAVAQPSLSMGTIRQIPVPICSPAEQTEITRILDARLDAADKMEAEIDAALARAEALRQSILKRAFAGDLVPQDPTDEPASTLLARIKAERAAALRNKTAKAKSTKPAKRKTKA